MVQINNDIYYKDYKKCLELLKQIDDSKFEYPEETTNFHIYSEIKTEKELLCVKSWIATQNLDKCSLTIWSDYDISNNELLKPFLKYINLKVYNPQIESKDTILEEKIEHLKAHDSKYWLKSDLFRILITHKYGGIFSDMDIVYLRDFKSILDQEFVYQWGSETDFINQGSCATFLSTFKNSDFSNHLMKELLNSPIVPNTTQWGKELLGRIYSHYKFTIFPSAFFNIEWQMNASWDDEDRKIYNPDGFGTKCESGWFVQNEYSGNLFLETFAWHWHNSSYKNTPVMSGSKFDLLSKYIDSKLLEKNLYEKD